MDNTDYGPAGHVRDLTRDQLYGEAQRLAEASGQLIAFLDGDLDAWTPGHTLALTLAAARVHGQVGTLRDLEEKAAARRAAAAPPALAGVTGERVPFGSARHLQLIADAGRRAQTGGEQ